MSEEQFNRVIDTDPDFGFDKVNGQALYACAMLSVPEGTAAASAPQPPTDSALLAYTNPGSAAPGEADPVDTSLAFKLHSRPGAPRVILLDFDGHVTSGTAWNSGRAAQIVTPAYDTDGNPSAFSAVELTNIINIWRAVAEDFSAFDVDVTTEDNGVVLYDRGTRCVIGGSSKDWLGGDYGGIAYVGVFGRLEYMPAFVFPKQLGNGYTKYVAEAISHEVGHNLGLNHDGLTTGEAYYTGAGNWAPIMGVGYYKDITQWSKGEYPNANNLEDDLGIMTNPRRVLVKSRQYLAYRPDDHANSAAAASPLVGTPSATDAAVSTAAAAGVIERTGDADWLAFEAGAGALALTVAVTPAGPNGAARASVDLSAALYANTAAGPALLTSWDAAGALLSGAQDGAQLPAAGKYYLVVSGTGDGDLATGYSSYGSLGQYKVSLSYPTFVPPPVDPAALVKVVLVSSRAVYSRRKWSISATFQFTNSNGAAISGVSATLDRSWSGDLVASQSSSTTLPDNGQMTVTSPSSTATSGTATLTLTAVTIPGYTWSPADSTITTTVSWP
ncbi:MAG: hypothetical protein J3K34DRAFT_53546 [Monoraphidium minutum]|nr:MAG: hypothetical protein J3K34DRAFT_53546 [Monoraphidium minutum]